jgi:hypothetical protein
MQNTDRLNAKQKVMIIDSNRKVHAEWRPMNGVISDTKS